MTGLDLAGAAVGPLVGEAVGCLLKKLSNTPSFRQGQSRTRQASHPQPQANGM